MPVIATEPKRLSDLLKVIENDLYAGGYMTTTVVANEAAATDYVIGTLLGKVTATGKYVIWDSAAVDGSQTLAAVVFENKSLAIATDTSVYVLVRGGAILADLAIELGGETLAAAAAGLLAFNPPVLLASQI